MSGNGLEMRLKVDLGWLVEVAAATMAPSLSDGTWLITPVRRSTCVSMAETLQCSYVRKSSTASTTFLTCVLPLAVDAAPGEANRCRGTQRVDGRAYLSF